MSLNEILASGGALLLFLTLVQITPIKVNPWSAVGKIIRNGMRVIGKSMNKDVMDKLESVQKELKELGEKHNKLEIEIWNNEEGPIARITVYIAGSGLAEDETVIDTNNCPWAMELIKQHGFGQATGRMVRSGYCTYPVVKLDIEKIGEYLA